MIADNLKKYFPDKTFETTKIDLHMLGERDITCMDAAQILTDNEQPFANELKALNASKDDAIIISPIWGITGNFSRDVVQTQIRAQIIETTCLPPSPPGIRIQ